MIGLPRGLTVIMYGEPVDMRKSFNTLSALVAHEMKRDLLEGDLFLFVGRDRKRAKVLYFDGTGLCLLSNQPSSYCTSFGPRNVSCSLTR
jgi:transposase